MTHLPIAAKAFLAGLLVFLVSACSSFRVAPGVVIRADHPPVTALLIDVSRANGLYAGSDWQTDFVASLVKNAPGVFSAYNVKADVLAMSNEAAVRPGFAPGQAHLLTVVPKDMYRGTNGTAFGFIVTLYSPEGVKLWQSNAGFAGSPFRNQSEAAVILLDNLAQKLDQAGMFSAKGNPGAQQAMATGSAKLTGRSLEAFESFKSKPYPRAFAVEDDRHFFMEWGQGSNSLPPAERALKKCADAGYKGCRVLAADGQVF